MPYLPPAHGFGSNEEVKSNSAARQIDYTSFDSFYKSKYGYSTGPYGIVGRINDWFTGQTQSAEKEYEQYITNKANRETWYREDTAVQRAMADYKAAGLNPYLLVNSGSVAQAPSSQAQRPDHYGKRKSSKDVSVLGTALKLLAILALKG